MANNLKDMLPPEKILQRPIVLQKEKQNKIIVPGDPLIASHQHWYDTGGTPSMQLIRSNNEVTYLIDGQETFHEMVATIKTAQTSQHFIYLLAWWLTDNFQLIPGDPSSTIAQLFTSASGLNVQIRAMLWDQAGTQNTNEVDAINALANGAAILDNRTLNFGSHHQKILIVKGSEGLISFCGGVDPNPDRLNVIDAQSGQPLHDVHCRIKGPAAYDLLRIFIERWNDHPDHINLDNANGALLGISEPIPPSMPNGKHFVQIGRTYPNGNRHRGIDSDQLGTRPRGYTFAPNGEQTTRRLIHKAIGEAKKFIYVEEQYLVDMATSRLLQRVIQNINHLTILIPQGNISDLPQVHFRRREFIAPLRAAGGPKVRIYFLNPAGNNHTYVHAKTWIIDDEFAIIGSANCNRRGYTHDSEVVAGIFDSSSEETPTHHFAHNLRIQLWAEHLNMDTPSGRAQLNDGVASAVFWERPSAGAHIAPYDENINIESVHTDAAWNSVEDPDGS